jgi:hypothetical protein
VTDDPNYGLTAFDKICVDLLFIASFCENMRREVHALQRQMEAEGKRTRVRPTLAVDNVVEMKKPAAVNDTDR